MLTNSNNVAKYCHLFFLFLVSMANSIAEVWFCNCFAGYTDCNLFLKRLKGILSTYGPVLMPFRKNSRPTRKSDETHTTDSPECSQLYGCERNGDKKRCNWCGCHVCPLIPGRSRGSSFTRSIMENVSRHKGPYYTE